jgi:serpin B
MSIRSSALRRSFHRQRILNLESLENRIYLSGVPVAGPLLPAEPSDYMFSSRAQGTLTTINAATEPVDVHVTEGEFTRAVEAINRFAFDLYNHYQNQQGNLFLSPMSISAALAMAYAGAAGDTAAQMAEVMHLGNTPGIHDSFRALLDTLNAEGDAGNFSLDIANALWPQKDFPFRDEYLQLIKQQYGGGLQTLDYIGDAEAARQIINTWVADQTHDKIKNLIPEGGLSDTTRLVLTNAIYFKGQWAAKFDSALTADRPFYFGSGESANVPTMYQKSAFHYTELDGYQVLDMPYTNDDLSMIVLLPKSRLSLPELGYDTIMKVNDWIDKSVGKSDVNLYLPRFKMTVTSGLGGLLSGMGMSTAFDPERADFSGMAYLNPDENLYIDKVFHKAFVEVNEEGTEAAAATAIVISSGCFAAGTPVCMPHGSKRIEDIQPGDLVLSRNEFDVNGDIMPKRVEQCFVRTAMTINIHVAGQVVKVTKEHPLYVQNRGWIAAGELQEGDLLATDIDQWRQVEKVVVTGDLQKVYNFRVADFHTYFLGGDAWGFGLWVHNTICGGAPEPITFNADHAFHFLIRDNHTGAILFVGRMADPTQAENIFDPVYSEDESTITANQSTWATPPTAVDGTSIRMTAAPPANADGAEYYFHCLTPGGHDSDWQSSSTYTDSGLTSGTTYYYQVKTRNLSVDTSESSYSVDAGATTLRNSDIGVFPIENPIFPIVLNSPTFFGTTGNDIFEFHAGNSLSDSTLFINGVKQAISADANKISIDGMDGNDQLLFYGSSASLTADLKYESGTFTFGQNSFAYSNLDSLTVVGASGNNIATLHDSTGDDSFEALPGSARLASSGKAITLKNFKKITAEATSGNDTAVLFASSSGNSQYVAGPTGVAFSGSDFNYLASGFDAVSAYASPGKNNTAVFNSTDGADILIASSVGAQYLGANFAYDVWNLSSIVGNGGSGDDYRFYGSSGSNTTLELTPTSATQTETIDLGIANDPRPTNGRPENSAKTPEQTIIRNANINKMLIKGSGYSKFASYVWANGDTTATITGTAAAERAVSSPLGAQLFGDNFELSAWTYKHINIVGNGGTDTAEMYATAAASTFSGVGQVATMTTGSVDRTMTNFSQVTAHGNAASNASFIAKADQTNTFELGPTQASMAGAGYTNIAQGFGSNAGYGIVGGTDVVNYTDSVGDDLFISSYLGTQMSGTGFNNSAWNFATATATASSGYDSARFYGSSADADSFTADPTQAIHVGKGFHSEAKIFDSVESYSGKGSGGTAVLTGSTEDDAYVASPQGAQLSGTGYRIEAWNYSSVKTDGVGGNDIANLYGATSGNRLAADTVFAEFSGTGFANRVDRFAMTRIRGSATDSDTATLDHAYMEIGIHDTPSNATSLTIARKLWLYDFDMITTTEDQIPENSVLKDKFMTAFMYE